MSGPTRAEGLSRPRVLRVVFGSTFLVRFAFGLTLSVFASYVSGSSVGFGAESVGTIGLVAALAPVGEFTTVLLTGNLADRRGRFPVLLGAIGSAAVLMVLIALSRDPIWLGAVNFLFGVTSGAILTSSLALVGDESGTDERGLEMGRFDAMNLLGWVLGFAVGFGLLGAVANSSLGGLFVLGGAVLAGGFAYAWASLRGVSEAVGGYRGIELGRLLRTAFRAEILLVTLPWLVIYLLLGTLFVFLGGASSSIGLPSWELASFIGGGGLLLLATQPYFGRLADRFGRMRLMAIGTVGFIGVLTGAALLATFGVSIVAIALVGLSALPALSYGPAALAALVDATRSISRATTMSVYTLTISLGMIGGLVISTSLYDRYGASGLDLFFAGIAVGLGTLTALRYRALRPRPAAGTEPSVPVTTRVR
ncbi:MAG: MFS transporter [Thermoplasmata archaeon]|nr:MFS transporter [Thermoplasmata archaeon]MCI4360023.1 MFS transporter [Thermoplasmata archaeon]